MLDAVAQEKDEQRPRLWRRILTKLYECSTMLVLCFSVFMALWTRHVRLAQQPEKVHTPNDRPPIFPPDSVNMIDIRNGSMEALRSLTWRHDSVAAMLYAPWSGQSRKAAPWFAEAALQLRDEVLFVAIDCWYLHGTCRQDISVPVYPRVVVYFSSNMGFLEYIGGLRSYEIARFVRLVVRPLFFVSTEAAYESFVSSEETVVLGYFDFELDPEPREYLAYLGAARLALADDIGDGLRFGVISSVKVALVAEMPHHPSIMLCRSTRPDKLFDGDWTPEAIYEWALDHREQHVRLLVNSLDLIEKIRKQPAVILFLPLNDSSITNRFLRMLRRIAGALYSCPITHWVQTDSTVVPHYCTNYNLCDQNVRLHTDVNVERDKCSLRCYYYSLFKLWTSQSAVDTDGQHWCELPESDDGNVAKCYDLDKHLTDCKGQSDFIQSNAAVPDDDDVEDGNVSYLDRIVGLGCRGQRSHNLSFFYMDSNKHWVYAQALAVDHELLPRIVVTIADMKNRSQFVHDEDVPISEDTTAEFIWKFLHTKLEPRLNSASVPTSPCVPSHLSGCVWEVVGQTFDEIVLDKTKDVLLLHYSSACAFCSTLVPAILRLSHALKSYHHVRIARLNRDDNDLPRGIFQPVVYPSLVLYLADRKTEPLLYPRDAPLTVADLVAFLRRHLSLPGDVNLGSHHQAASKLWSLRQERNKAVEKEKSLQSLVDYLKGQNRFLLARIIVRSVEMQWYRQRVDELLTEIDALGFDLEQSACLKSQSSVTETDRKPKTSLKVKWLERRIHALVATNAVLFRTLFEEQRLPMRETHESATIDEEPNTLRARLETITLVYRSVKGRFDLLRFRCRHITSELMASRSFIEDTVSRYEALVKRVQRTVGLVIHATRAIQEGVYSVTDEERRANDVVGELEEALRMWTRMQTDFAAGRRSDLSDLSKSFQPNEVDG
ncbi:thioredoxin domain-containing protein 11-like isoform X2 [Corticium candelabrum]|uniref:thioredoxin domain-containing protein 11-like isoform X2 n=1 Tax=Corticium candelabrum TaxID=121492 RepID=UPI002E35AAA2|nr:thioredoxin domain-containing protein 11-like isoform X2 [Corticium candelabrum]